MITLVIILTIIFSAFFSGMEIAFIAHNRLRLELDLSRGKVKLPFIRFIFKDPSKYIATMLVGNNVALVIYGLATARLLEPYLANYIHSEFWVLITQTVISTIVILFFAEFIPKSIFRAYPNLTLNLFSPFVAFFYILFYPVTILTIGITNFFIKYVARREIDEQNKKRILGRADLDNFIDQIKRRFKYDENLDEKLKYIEKTLDFENIKVRQCMVPRNELDAVPDDISIKDLIEKFANSNHSKLIVYHGNIDNVVGYVHVRSLFNNPSSLSEILINIPAVPETMSAKKLLDLLIKEKKSIALVVDEYGGTAGIVTIEDVLEEIVGEIEDEYDKEEFVEVKVNDKQFIFSARLEIDYINEKYNLHLPESEEYNTIAGLLMEHLEAIPQKGEKLKVGEYIIEVLDTSGPKVNKVQIEVMDTQTSGNATSENND